jgi:hypothetical protein
MAAASPVGAAGAQEVFPFQSVVLAMALVGTQNSPLMEEGGFQPSPSVQLVPEAKANLLHAHVLFVPAGQLLS